MRRPIVNKVECVERLFHASRIPSSQPWPLKPTRGEPGCDGGVEYIMGTRWLSSSVNFVSRNVPGGMGEACRIQHRNSHCFELEGSTSYQEKRRKFKKFGSPRAKDMVTATDPHSIFEPITATWTIPERHYLTAEPRGTCAMYLSNLPSLNTRPTSGLTLTANGTPMYQIRPS